MGLTERLLNALNPTKEKAVGLPLEMLLSPVIETPEGRRIVTYVPDPAIFRGSGLAETMSLKLAYDEQTSVNLDYDLTEAANQFRARLANDHVFGAAAGRMTDEQYIAWFSSGISLSQIETQKGLVTTPGRINSSTSAVIAMMTLSHGEPTDGALAQTVLRLGYATERIKVGGPEEATPALGKISNDPRLLLVSGDFQAALAWTDRMPSSRLRDSAVNELAGSMHDEERFLKSVRLLSMSLLVWFAQIASRSGKR